MSGVVSETITLLGDVLSHMPKWFMPLLLFFVLFYFVYTLLRVVIEPFRVQSIESDDSDSYSVEEISEFERIEPHVCEDDTNSVLLASLASSILLHNLFHRHD